MGRRLCVLLLLAGGGLAGEPDGAIAEAARWVEPRGCASGSFRSRARPVVTEIEEAWRLELERIAAPPVHWDGQGCVVGYADGKAVLVAFELHTGRELARASLRGYLEGSGLFAWGDMVFVQPTGDQITGYRTESARLEPAWIFRGRKYGNEWRHPRLPVVHDNEVYCFLGNGLARLRPGSKFPTWVLEGSDDRIRPELSGRPAIFGAFVFVALMGEHTITADAPGDARVHGKEIADLYLFVYRRSDGKRVAQRKVCQALHSETERPALQVTVAGDTVHIGSRWPLLSAGGLSTHAMVPLKISADSVLRAGEVGMWSYELPPAHHPGGTVVLSAQDNVPRWARYRDRRFYELTNRTAQPDLFKDKVSPTVLGDIVYFGSWAMDIETREIVWRLPFQDVTYPVVPADGLILVVESGKTLRAFRGRGRR